MKTLSTAVRSARAQLDANPVLRLGCWLVVGLCWGYALMLGSDWQQAARARIEELDAEVARLKPMQNARDWPARALEAQANATQLRTRLWTESRSGLAQAEVQDWLRQLAAKTGLTLRDLRLTTSDASLPGEAAPAPGAAASDLPRLPTDAVKARLSADFNPLSFSMLLQELTFYPKLVVVDRVQLKTWSQPPQVELDIRVPVLKAAAPR